MTCSTQTAQWICENCQTVHSEWTPVCDACEAFDTLSWRVPNRPMVAEPAQISEAIHEELDAHLEALPKE